MIIMRKCLIIYDTKSGNTKILTKMIQQSLESMEISVRTIQDKRLKDLRSIATYDIIGVGSPVHMNSLAFILRRKLKNIAKKKIDLKGKKLITFSTSKFPLKWEIANNKAVDLLKSTGIEHFASFGCQNLPSDEFSGIVQDKLKKI